MTRSGLLSLFDKYGILPTPQRIEIVAILLECPQPFDRQSATAILCAAAGLAQLVEHIIRNDGVRSSNLLSGTIS